MKKFYITFILLFALTCGSFAQQVNVGRNAVEVVVKIARFYPNPATSFINFEFDGIDRSSSLQIYNFLGKKMADEPIANNKISFNLDNYYRGLYIFQIRDKSGNIVESGKFQVIK